MNIVTIFSRDKALTLDNYFTIMITFILYDFLFIYQIIHGDDPVKGLAWAGERLFACYLNGKIIEWDLLALKEKVFQS